MDLLSYMSERGSHTFETEDDAIKYLTGDSSFKKNDLLKIFNSIRQENSTIFIFQFTLF